MTFHLSQPLRFEGTEGILLEASYAITAVVGALARSAEQTVLLGGDALSGSPSSPLMWQLLCIGRELAFK